MGSCQTKVKKNRATGGSDRVVSVLKNKVRLLQGEMNEIMCIREAESQVYNREVMAFAFKQAEWRRERKRLKDEVRKLRKALDAQKHRDETQRRPGRHRHRHRPRTMEDDVEVEVEVEVEEDCVLGRDETVEKWKQLYLAIKVELDDLIQRTHQEKRVCRKSKEEWLLELEQEKKANEEEIQLLQTKLASMELEEYKREREMDILKQSIRIMCHRHNSNIKSKAAWP